jgi:hypothetical protein
LSAAGMVRDGSWEQDPSLLRARIRQKKATRASINTLHGPPVGGVRKG